MSTCGHHCHEVGGPWIAEDPDCPVHGSHAQEEEAEVDFLREELEAVDEALGPKPWRRLAGGVSTPCSRAEAIGDWRSAAGALGDQVDRFAGQRGAALTLIETLGGTDGAHGKQWVLDQVVRALHGCVGGESNERYLEWVCRQKDGEDGPDTYDWDEGIAP
jgi:hypothetical protein